jgi:hypothetical protein
MHLRFSTEIRQQSRNGLGDGDVKPKSTEMSARKSSERNEFFMAVAQRSLPSAFSALRCRDRIPQKRSDIQIFIHRKLLA